MRITYPLFILTCLLLPAADHSSAEEVFATQFLTDHAWRTDQPDRFYWNQQREVFYARMENAVPDYDPNRFCVLRTRLDPRKSFQLEWDVFIYDLAVYGHCSFGLYSADMLNANRTYIYLPRLISESTINMDFSGWGSSDGFQVDIVDSSGNNHGFGSYGGGADYSGRWLHCRLSYDSDTEQVAYAVVEKDTGATVRSGTRSAGVFSPGMIYLGMSQYPVGQDPRLIYATRPQDSAIMEIDNIVLNGELSPPPHFTQASGAPWQADILLGSTDPNDTIARYGCFLSSTAMLLQHFGHDVDPGSLNTFLSSSAPQSDGFLRFGMIPNDVSSYGQTSGWDGVPVRFLHGSFPSDATRDDIVEIITRIVDDYGPVILRVPQYADGTEHYPAWQHAILAWRVTDGTVLVRDPGSARSGLPVEREIDTLSLDDYVDYVRASVAVQYQPDTSWVFLRGTRYTYAEALTIRSGPVMVGSLNSPVEIVVTAPDGSQLGRDPHSDTNYDTLASGEIARSAGIAAPDGTLMPPPEHFPADIAIGDLAGGEYTVDVYGTAIGPWSLNLQVTGSGVSTSQVFSFTGTASSVSHDTLTFEVSLPPRAVAPSLSIWRAAETNSLRLLWQGIYSNRYLVQRSYDLADWRTISTEAITGSNVTVSFPLPGTQSNASFYSVEALRITEQQN